MTPEYRAWLDDVGAAFARAKDGEDLGPRLELILASMSELEPEDDRYRADWQALLRNAANVFARARAGERVGAELAMIEAMLRVDLVSAWSLPTETTDWGNPDEFALAEAHGYEEVSDEELEELIAAGAVEVFPEFLPRADVDSDELELAKQAGYEEVSAAEVEALIAAGAREVTPDFHADAAKKAVSKKSAKAAGPGRAYHTGPRGGVYYIAASGRKVYARKKPAGADSGRSKPTGASKPKRTPEEARKARNARARERRAEKKAEFERKKQAEWNEFVERSKREQVERQSRIKAAEAAEAKQLASGSGPKTRAEAAAALRKHVDNLVIGDSVRDHEVINAYNALKAAGVEKIYGAHNKLPNLVLGARVVQRELNEHGSIDTISHKAWGLYSNRFLHGGGGYIKVTEKARDLNAVERVRVEENRTAINEYNRRQGRPEVSDVTPLGSGHAVQVPKRELTAVLIHEFGHAVHLEPIGQHREIDAIVQRAFNDSRRLVSNYGETNHKEYFAEAHVAYHYRREELKTHAPNAHKMVEDVLRLRGIL